MTNFTNSSNFDIAVLNQQGKFLLSNNLLSIRMR